LIATHDHSDKFVSPPSKIFFKVPKDVLHDILESTSALLKLGDSFRKFEDSLSRFNRTYSPRISRNLHEEIPIKFEKSSLRGIMSIFEHYMIVETRLKEFGMSISEFMRLVREVVQ